MLSIWTVEGDGMEDDSVLTFETMTLGVTV